MTETTRKIGIEVLEDCPWGTHICLFYENKEDLLETLVPYFKAGLENNEYCMWITSELLTKDEIVDAMREVVSQFDSYMEKNQIEIIPAKEWYRTDIAFNAERTLDSWIKKVDTIVKKGYDGLRVFGNPLWVEKKIWDNFKDYEDKINEVLPDYPMLAICSYSLTKFNPTEIIEALRNHKYALIKYNGNWERFKDSIEINVEKKLRESESKLKERVKELKCLYEISKIAERPYISIDDIIKETLDLIRSSWQFPEITCARIIYNKKESTTKNYRESQWKLSSKIKIDNKIMKIEVYYLKEAEFLQEEKHLIEDIAKRLKHILENKKATKKERASKKELRKMNLELEQKVEARTKKLKESQEKYQNAFEEAAFFKDIFMHDINNVLQNIKSSTELSLGFLQRPEKTEEIKELLEIIVEQIDRGRQLVSTVRKLSELDEIEITIKKIDVCNPLKNTIKLIKNSIQGKEIKIHLESYNKIVFVQANGLIADVFENILGNAVKYNENPTIEILIRISQHSIKKKKYVKLEFIDNGIGIRDKKKKIIFQKGYKKSIDSKGMGIGLSLVHKAVLSYKGKIWVEDRVKGDYSRGSNFVVLIPQTV
ncbi:hypothetical protein LCGC14_0586690 [marine sediment metagenome]|uniref:Histidine kinase domain-containing protein n=2 Tax=marine sediment metagenome TaxID=412755 RepID=A0A0F9UN05_9ZZZZ|nr:MAG: Signal transduction histidine kinase [Candidatus Lokiarchaeum sp. GC14_75]